MVKKTNLKIEFEDARIIDHTSVGGSFVEVGSSLGVPALGAIFTSSLDQPIFISTDGSSVKFMIRSLETLILPLDLFCSSPGAALPGGTQFFVKEGPDGAPSTGDLVISILYGRA